MIHEDIVSFQAASVADTITKQFFLVSKFYELKLIMLGFTTLRGLILKLI